MVGKQSRQLEWQDDERGPSSNSDGNRCLPLRLGWLLGCWDPQENSCLVCSESIHKRCLEQDSADLIQPVKMGGTRSPDLMFSKQAVPNSSAHSGKSEHHRRLPVPLSEGQNRLGPEPGSIQGSQLVVGSLSGGSVFHTFLSSSTQIFQLEGRPRSRSNRCLHTELEWDSRVCSSPWCLITTTLTIITPLWKTQPWFPVIMEMVVDHPILLPDWEDVVTPSPNCGCPVQKSENIRQSWKPYHCLLETQNQCKLQLCLCKHIMFRPFQHTFRLLCRPVIYPSKGLQWGSIL